MATFSSRHSAALCSMALMLPLPTLAGTAAAFNSELSVGASLMEYDYCEYQDDGSLYNREKGYLPGLTLDWHLLPSKDWWVAIKLARHDGTIDYNGKTSGGAPIKTKTEEAITDISFSIGRPFLISSDTTIDTFGGLGYSQWRRDIQSTPSATGLLENYTWHYFFAGAKANIIQTGNINVSIEGQITRTFDSEISIDFHGIYDGATLPLRDRNGFKLSLPITKNIAEATPLRIETYWNHWEFGRSPTRALTVGGTPAGTVYEPSSKTNTVGITISLTKSF